MTSIALSQLTKRFGSTTAVDDVSLTINSGELFFLLGPSGCGKTTLLRMIAGFVEPTAGRIRFGERDVTSLPPNKRNAGMVFQSYALWPHMTVEQNVAYGLNVRRTPSPEKRERITAALRMVHMDQYAQRKPNQLSGGQQQRVALARALVIRPTVLLLDEPLSNLDAKLRLEMRSEIRRICSETKITTVYVTHDQKEALSMADSMAVLHDGRVMQLGPPREMYHQPRSRFVADFLGETNFLPATVKGTENGFVVLETPAGMLRGAAEIAPPTARPPAAPPLPRTIPVGGEVTCSIRPEALRIEPQRGSAHSSIASSMNSLHGRRVRTIYLGEFAQHQIEIGGKTMVIALEMNPSRELEAIDDVVIKIDPNDIVIVRE